MRPHDQLRHHRMEMCRIAGGPTGFELFSNVSWLAGSRDQLELPCAPCSLSFERNPNPTTGVFAMRLTA